MVSKINQSTADFQASRKKKFTKSKNEKISKDEQTDYWNLFCNQKRLICFTGKRSALRMARSFSYLELLNSNSKTKVCFMIGQAFSCLASTFVLFSLLCLQGYVVHVFNVLVVFWVVIILCSSKRRIRKRKYTNCSKEIEYARKAFFKSTQLL